MNSARAGSSSITPASTLRALEPELRAVGVRAGAGPPQRRCL